MIRSGKWNNNSEFSDMKKRLLKMLNIQNDSDALQRLEQIQNDSIAVLQLLEQIREMQKKDK